MTRGAGRWMARAAMAIVLAVVASSCGGSAEPNPSASPTGSPTPDSIEELTGGALALSLLSTESPQRPGTIYFGFDLTTDQGSVLTGGSPHVYVALDRTSKALGPFPATWYPFAPKEDFDDTSPRSPLPGTFAANISVPSAGNWVVAVIAKTDGKAAAATGALSVIAGDVPAEIGSRAISVKTPVATTEAEARKIDTRDPPSPMHYISLDQALINGKPTVVSFATPLLCESQLCGPVVDEQLLAFQHVGKERANFIHVEEFLPGEDLTPPPPTLENISPGFKAWGFETEPWVIVIDRDGIIRARFEGPVTAAQIEAALQPLL